ncbi:MAG: hypothetical protein RJA35_49 [Actinomycetota bacterium]|jgi:urea carboxylase-associated protein 2
MSESTTSSTEGARLHAREQVHNRVETMPIIPASAAFDWPSGVSDNQKLWAETVEGGNYTTLFVKRGAIIELTDVYGDACAHLALYNATQTDERLNVADTVKVQWQAYLGPGQLLLSDRGRALASILLDTSGKHDTFAGMSHKEQNEAKYGDGDAFGPSPAGRELMILAAAKAGLEPRDIPPTVSLFKGFYVQPNGGLVSTGSAGAYASVWLRAEMPIILLIANAAHPLDIRNEYVCTPLKIRIWEPSPESHQNFPAVPFDVEAERALANTRSYLALKGI